MEFDPRTRARHRVVSTLGAAIAVKGDLRVGDVMGEDDVVLETEIDRLLEKSDVPRSPRSGCSDS